MAASLLGSLTFHCRSTAGLRHLICMSEMHNLREMLLCLVVQGLDVRYYVWNRCRVHRSYSSHNVDLLIFCQCSHLFIYLFIFEEEALHVSQTCHRSNISGQLKETSGMKAYTARPTTGEAALPWQAIFV